MKVGALYELPRPRFVNWLFGIRPAVEFIIDDPTYDAKEVEVFVECVHKGSPLEPSLRWPSHKWRPVSTSTPRPLGLSSRPARRGKA